jgi:adenosylcobinamide-phosphate synthase
MSVALLCVAGVALDALLGEPRRWHPLVAFGNFAGRIEQRFNSGGRGWRSHGVTAWFIAVVPLTLLATALSWRRISAGCWRFWRCTAPSACAALASM